MIEYYYYAPLMRPAEFAGLPSGWEYTHMPLGLAHLRSGLPCTPPQFRYGIIRYTRPLSEDSVEHCDLRQVWMLGEHVVQEEPPTHVLSVEEYKKKAHANLLAITQTGGMTYRDVFAIMRLTVNVLSRDPGQPKGWDDRMRSMLDEIADAIRFLEE